MARKEIGRIKPGYLGDMILADGNPIANLKTPQDATLEDGRSDGQGVIK